MPTQIVELDELVPDDINFRYQGKDYILPGDITVETTFRLQRLLTELLAAEADPKKVKDQEKLTLEIEQLLLGLFQQKDPKLEALPFGAVGFRYVLAFILKKLGFGEDPEPEDPPKPNRATRRATAKKSSRRSSTSGS